VELNPREGHLTYDLVRQRQLDFSSFREVLRGAGYTLRAIELRVPGTVVERPCEPCGANRSFLRVDRSGQLLELGGGTSAGQAGPLGPAGQAGTLGPAGQAGTLGPAGQAGTLGPAGQALRLGARVSDVEAAHPRYRVLQADEDVVPPARIEEVAPLSGGIRLDGSP